MSEFRSAPVAPSTPTGDQPTTPVSEPTTSVTSTDVEAGPFIYKQVTGQPYSVKHFELKDYYSDSDFEEVKDMADAVDEYIITKARAKGLENSDKAYQSVLKEIYKHIGSDTAEDKVKALKRVYTASQALKRLEEAKMPSVLDAKTLTVEEYEELSE